MKLTCRLFGHKRVHKDKSCPHCLRCQKALQALECRQKTTATEILMTNGSNLQYRGVPTMDVARANDDRSGYWFLVDTDAIQHNGITVDPQAAENFRNTLSASADRNAADRLDRGFNTDHTRQDAPTEL